MTREEILARLDALANGDSNDEEIDGMREIIHELLAEREGQGQPQLLEARAALETLDRAFTLMGRQVADLTARSSALDATVPDLNDRLIQAQARATAAEHSNTELSERAKELEGRNKDLARQLAEEIDRANQSTEEATSLADKARRFDLLEEAAKELVQAFGQLPTKMEDAGVVPASFKPEIELYGTYEWQAVVTAKLLIDEALK